MVLVDTNVLLDISPTTKHGGPGQSRRSTSMRIVLDRHLDDLTLARLPLPYQAAFPAGRAFLRYRRAGGERSAPLPDFYIGAHAQTQGLTLLTRDANRYRTYFPSVPLITPAGQG